MFYTLYNIFGEKIEECGIAITFAVSRVNDKKRRQLGQNASGGQFDQFL